MSDYVMQIINSFPALIAQGGYWLISIIVILEGIPLLGSFFPGHVAIVAAGFLAKLGILSLPLVLIVATVSAIIGDYIGFFVGRRYGYSFLIKWGKYIFIKEEHFEKARKLIDGHTGKALIMGRFSPLTRPLTPFIVGSSGVSLKNFSIFNIIGAILWIFASVFLGYAFGASYGVASEFFGTFIVIALIITVLILWGYRFVNLRFHVFRKYELIVLILNLLALWGLAKTIQDAFSLQPFLTNFDEWVNNLALSSMPEFITSFSGWISNIGGTEAVAIVGSIIGLIFLIKKRFRRAMIMLLSVGSTSIVVFIIKDIVSRARPENLIELANNSFPSGHASLAAAFFVAFVYIYVPYIHSWVKRELFIIVCVIITVLIGLSRIFLNVHWASDVIAGWCLGIFLATSSILLVRYVGALFISDKK